MAAPVNNKLEQVTMAQNFPLPVLGSEPPTETPDVDTDWQKEGVATSGGAAVNFTGMKEGEIWKFQFFDGTAPDDNTVPPENVAFRPYNGTDAAVATDAFHRTTQPHEFRVRAKQVGVSYIALGASVKITGTRLL